MPQRQGTRRVDASAVQGDGAYVIVRKVSYGLAQEARKITLAGAPEQQDAFTSKMLGECVLEWNWVDDKGEPLPLPSVGGIAGLTVEETNFLATAIAGGASPN